MLLKSFFRVNPYNPSEPEGELIFSKETPGTFEFEVPKNTRYLRIEIGGARGGQVYNGAALVGVGGSGEKTIIVRKYNGKKITGVVGQMPTGVGGGSGFSNGQAPAVYLALHGGGGGGSTGFTVEGERFEASGGGGASYYPLLSAGVDGGNGAGPKGGQKGTLGGPGGPEYWNGYSAKSNSLSSANNGYIKIYHIIGE